MKGFLIDKFHILCLLLYTGASIFVDFFFKTVIKIDPHDPYMTRFQDLSVRTSQTPSELGVEGSIAPLLPPNLEKIVKSLSASISPSVKWGK